EGGREYAFRHSVTREVAYGSLPKARRARLHAAFATWLQRVGGGRGGAAREREVVWRLAATWLRRAGELAVSRYDLDEGIRLLHQAVDLETDATTQAGLWRAIGRANALGFQGPAFWEAMERSLELTDDRSTRGETYAELGFQTSFRGGMWARAPERGLVSSWIGEGVARH